VTYSLFGRLHRWISLFALVVILFLGITGWLGWIIWVVLLLLLGIDHPPTLDRFSSLDPRRKLYGWCTVGLFALTFIPVPISTSERVIIPAAEVTEVAYDPGSVVETHRPLRFLYQP
jgi:hypothetical protein